MSKEAMKRALENSMPSFMSPEWTLVRNEDIAALREALAEPDFWEGYVPEPDKRQQALDKKAENARELGLDYEPAQDSGVVTAGGFDPRTQRTWVGLTDEELSEVYNQADWDTVSGWEYERAIEAKLKERNL